MKKLLLIFLIPVFSFTQSGDTNGDGFVNLEDLFNVLENWLQEVNANDPESISNIDEMINVVDSLITLNHNINYGLSIEGWVDNDFQSTWNEADVNINIAPSSGIVYVNDLLTNGESISGCVGNYTAAVVNDELIMENTNTTHRSFSFPVKKDDEFIIWGGCFSQIQNDIFSENNSIKFFSFGDSNYGSGSSSVSNSISSPNTIGAINDFHFPQGKNGEYIFFLGNTNIYNYYQVPEGKTLYIIGSQNTSSIEFPFCEGFPVDETEDYTYLFSLNANTSETPIIKSGNTIRFSGNFTGILIDEVDNIEIVNQIVGECDDGFNEHCFEDNEYTIEENKAFVYLHKDGINPSQIGYANSSGESSIISTANINIDNPYGVPILKGPGTITSVSGCIFISGYIININE